MKISSIVLVAIFLVACGGDFQKDFIQKFQKGPNGEVIPEPKFDKPIQELLEELKAKYDASGVRLGRPFSYSSEDDLRYWIKVSLMNPEIEDKDKEDFDRMVASEIVKHLTNPSEFEEIEVSVTKKVGFIITFSQSWNSFFPIEALQVDSF